MASPSTDCCSTDITTRLANITVQAAANVPSDVKVGDEVPFSQFWSKSPVIIVFLRRFGCDLCRLASVKLSRHHEQLKHLGVRLVAIGLEKLGMDDFVGGKFFSGELYVDVGKKAYKALNLKSYNAFTGILALANSGAITAHKESKKEGGFGGNFKGDGFQLGATFVFDLGGALRFQHRQQNYGDQPDIPSLVSLCTSAYGTSSSIALAAAAAPSPDTDLDAQQQPVCTSEQCSA